MPNTPTTRLRVKATTLTATLAVTMIGTIVFSYLTCVAQGECPAPPQLPTISNTWTHPPGSFLSRFVVSAGSLCLGLLQFCLWLPLKQTPKTRLYLGLAVLSTMGLSGVGAVCDDDNPQCRGNNTVHTYCAMTFFALSAIR